MLKAYLSSCTFKRENVHLKLFVMDLHAMLFLLGSFNSIRDEHTILCKLHMHVRASLMDSQSYIYYFTP